MARMNHPLCFQLADIDRQLKRYIESNELDVMKLTWFVEDGQFIVVHGLTTDNVPFGSSYCIDLSSWDVRKQYGD